MPSRLEFQGKFRKPVPNENVGWSSPQNFSLFEKSRSILLFWGLHYVFWRRVGTQLFESKYNEKVGKSGGYVRNCVRTTRRHRWSGQVAIFGDISSFWVACSDITNDQFGISRETVSWGGNLRIYCVQSYHLMSGGSNIWVRRVTPHSSHTRGCWYQQ